MYLVESRPKLDSRFVAHPRLECRENLRALFSFDRQNERKAEALCVAVVQFLKPRELRRRALVKACPRLLAARFRRQFSGDSQLARKIWMGTQERQLHCFTGRLDNLAHGCCQTVQ